MSRVSIDGMPVDRLTERQVVAHVLAALRAGSGGHLITPNVDILRSATRDPSLRQLLTRAELAVADGMPLLWAARLLGRPIPERVTGADLIWSLSEAAAGAGLPIYLLGGGRPEVSERAAVRLRDRFPGLRVTGVDAPPYSFAATPSGLEAVRRRVVAADPRIVFVGMGFPRQDLLISLLRPALPHAWFVGCGAAIPFAAGAVRRAPQWMQSAGLEWLFRLINEPRRLARRYLVDDLPYALRLLSGCAVARLRQ